MTRTPPRLPVPLLLLVLVPLVPALLLAACSDEPSEADMRAAVEAGTRARLEAAGQGGFRRFDQFRKQGCVDARDKSAAWDCYYAATFVPRPGQPPLSVNGKGRFRHAARGLSFEDLGAQPR